MSDESAVVPLRERVNRNLWRVLLIAVTLPMAAFAWHEPVVAVFGAAPVLLWCGFFARSLRTGMIFGLILLALTAWFVLLPALGLSGRWLPSVYEVFWLLPVLTAVVCAIGLTVERNSKAPRGALPSR